MNDSNADILKQVFSLEAENKKKTSELSELTRQVSQAQSELRDTIQNRVVLQEQNLTLV
jgi:hypothetical protein